MGLNIDFQKVEQTLDVAESQSDIITIVACHDLLFAMFLLERKQEYLSTLINRLQYFSQISHNHKQALARAINLLNQCENFISDSSLKTLSNDTKKNLEEKYNATKNNRPDFYAKKNALREHETKQDVNAQLACLQDLVDSHLNDFHCLMQQYQDSRAEENVNKPLAAIREAMSVATLFLAFSERHHLKNHADCEALMNTVKLHFLFAYVQNGLAAHVIEKQILKKDYTALKKYLSNVLQLLTLSKSLNAQSITYSLAAFILKLYSTYPLPMKNTAVQGILSQVLEILRLDTVTSTTPNGFGFDLIASDRAELAKFRDEFKAQLAICSPIDMQSLLSTYSKSVLKNALKLWLRGHDFFPNINVAYAFTLFGSGARNELCPASDLEFAIVTQTDIHYGKDAYLWHYFSGLVTWFELQVICLGETPLKGYFDEWRLPDGFNFDEGGNVPCRGVRLIGSPEQLARHALLQNDMPGNLVVVNNFLSSQHLYGDRALYDDLHEKLNVILNQQHPKARNQCRQYFAVNLFETNKSDMVPFDKISELSVKSHLLKLPTFFLNSLALAEDIKVANNWQRTEALEKKHILNPIAAYVLKMHLSFSFWLRAHAHLHYGCEHEHIYLSGNSSEKDEATGKPKLMLETLYSSKDLMKMRDGVLAPLFDAMYDKDYAESVKSEIEIQEEAIDDQMLRDMQIKRQLNQRLVDDTKEKISRIRPKGNQDIRRILYQQEKLRRKYWKDKEYNNLAEPNYFIVYAELLVYFGDLAFKQEQWDKATECYENALKLHRVNPQFSQINEKKVAEKKNTCLTKLKNEAIIINILDKELKKLESDPEHPDLQVKLSNYREIAGLPDYMVRQKNAYLHKILHAAKTINPQCTMAELPTHSVTLAQAVFIRLRILIIGLIPQGDYDKVGRTYQLILMSAPTDEYRNALETEIKSFESALALKRKDRILYAISNCPEPDGSRQSHKIDEARWQDTLKTHFIESSANNGVTFTWVTREGKEITGELASPLVQSWLTPEGKIRPTLRTLLDGRHIVIPVKDKTKKIIAYVKIFPELPGIQFAVDELCRLLSGQTLSSTLGRLTIDIEKFTGKPSKRQQTYPVYISEARVTQTLQDAIRETSDLKDIERKIDSYNFTYKCLESMLFYPEDEKADNLVAIPVKTADGKLKYEIERIDTDHAFAEPLTAKLEDIHDKKIKVQVKSLLFCFKQMNEPLDPTAVVSFLTLDVMSLLKHWLSQLTIYNKQYIGDKKEKGLFDANELKLWLKQSQDSTCIPIAFLPGTVKKLYERLRRLYIALYPFIRPENVKDDSGELAVKTPMDLLSRVEPVLAKFYQDAFLQAKNPVARFHTLPTDYKVMKEQGKIVYQSVFQAREKTLRSITIADNEETISLKKAIESGQVINPQQLLSTELMGTHEQYMTINKRIDEIKNGQFKNFTQHESDFIKEEVANKIDWKNVDEKLVSRLLRGLNRTSFTKLDFSNFAALQNNRLIGIVRASPNLRRLRLYNCVNIRDNVIENVIDFCRFLEYLNVSKTGITQIRLAPESPYFAKLRQLNVSDAFQLEALEFSAPQLQYVNARNCGALSRFIINTKEIGEADLDGCTRIKYPYMKSNLATAGMSEDDLDLENLEYTIIEWRQENTELRLFNLRLTTYALQRIQPWMLKQVKVDRIDFSNNQLDDFSGFSLLTLLTELKQLTILSLKSNKLTDDTIGYVFVRLDTKGLKLKECNLSDNLLGDQSASVLGVWLGKNPELRSLDLRYNEKMTPLAVEAIEIAFQKNVNLTQLLIFDETKVKFFKKKKQTQNVEQLISKLDAKIYVNQLQHSTERRVNLSSSSLQGVDIGRVMFALAKNFYVKYISLADRKITPEIIDELIKLLQKQEYYGLDFQNNHLPEPDMNKLLNCTLELHHLRELDLSYTKPSVKQVSIVAHLLKRQDAFLYRLSYDGNGIGDTGAALIADALKENQTLAVLSLYWNDITSKGASLLVSTIRENMTLTILILEKADFNAKIDPAIQENLEKVLTRNKNLLKQCFQAVQKNDPERVYTLLNQGVCPYLCDEGDNTLLLAAAKAKAYALVSFFKDFDLDQAHKNKDGDSVESLAAKDEQLARTLILSSNAYAMFSKKTLPPTPKIDKQGQYLNLNMN